LEVLLGGPEGDKPTPQSRRRRLNRQIALGASNPGASNPGRLPPGPKGVIMENQEKRLSPTYAIIIYLVVLGFVAYVKYASRKNYSDLCQGTDIVSLHIWIVCLYVYIIMSIINYKYSFISFGKFMLVCVMLLFLSSSIGGFYMFIGIFINDLCYEYFKLTTQDQFFDNNIGAMVIEFIIFIIISLILSRNIDNKQ
jgi:hypothetical protein